jgi:N-acetyl-gamma-glutamyl-phosphate reductase
VFVHVVDEIPQTKWVSNTNNCMISVRYIERTGRLIIFSAIDNLIKGASGQAVQNMNVMFGIDEKEGLVY